MKLPQLFIASSLILFSLNFSALAEAFDTNGGEQKALTSKEIEHQLMVFIKDDTHLNHDVVQFIHAHQDHIRTDEEMAIAAIILARRHDDVALAKKISGLAMEQGFLGKRLIYELAFTLVLDNDCIRARPLLRAILDGLLTVAPHNSGDEDDWIAEESRKLILLCPEENIWFYDMFLDIGYDENLAGTAPQHYVTPEEGSALNQIIDQLRDAYPTLDFPDGFLVGQKPVAGGWTNLGLSLSRNWHELKKRKHLVLGLSQRITSPSGYEITYLNSRWIQEQDIAAIVLRNELKFSYQRRELGPQRHKSISYGGVAETGIEYRRPTTVGGTVFFGNMITSNPDSTTTSPMGIRLKASYAPANDQQIATGFWGNPMSIELEAKSTDASHPSAASKSKKLSLSYGPFVAVGPDLMSFLATYEHTRLAEPRYWLRSRHIRKNFNLRMIYHLRRGDPMMDLVILINQVRSPDTLEKEQNLSFLIRFSP